MYCGSIKRNEAEIKNKKTGIMVVKQIAEDTLNIKMEMLKTPKEMVSRTEFIKSFIILMMQLLNVVVECHSTPQKM